MGRAEEVPRLVNIQTLSGQRLVGSEKEVPLRVLFLCYGRPQPLGASGGGTGHGTRRDLGVTSRLGVTGHLARTILRCVVPNSHPTPVLLKGGRGGLGQVPTRS